MSALVKTAAAVHRPVLSLGASGARVCAAETLRCVTVALPTGCLQFSAGCPKEIHSFIHKLCACIAWGAKFTNPAVLAPGRTLPYRGPAPSLRCQTGVATGIIDDAAVIPTVPAA